MKIIYSKRGEKVRCENKTDDGILLKKKNKG
jgi:hypothetical protein